MFHADIAGLCFCFPECTRDIAVSGPIKTQLLGALFPKKKGRKPLEKTDLQVYEGQWQNDKAHGLGKYTSTWELRGSPLSGREGWVMEIPG